MNVAELLTALGIPGALAGVLATALGITYRHVKAMRSGLQALLRAQMIAEFNKWEERGYAPIYARENFENCWEQYHALGANGVMDDVREKFYALPTRNE